MCTILADEYEYSSIPVKQNESTALSNKQRLLKDFAIEGGGGGGGGGVGGVGGYGKGPPMRHRVRMGRVKIHKVRGINSPIKYSACLLFFLLI